VSIKKFFFSNRSYTPIPIVLLVLYHSEPKIKTIIIGLVILLIGEIIRVVSVSYAGGITRTRKVGAPSICSSGPYAYTRNPLYIGNILIYSGVVVISSAENIIFLLSIVLIFFITQYTMIVSLEEQTLEKLFPDQYRDYKKNVPRIIPRLDPWKNNDIRKPSPFIKTIKTEKRTLQNIVLIVCLILTKAYWINIIL
tara:strand:+ start:1000 stop:1587 length:588 start_codon:yes stop_codon:yes gene_type:complete